ncbi:hypothetical protein MACH17_34070 [Phaeobacter inhibens]|nr:hypothetical protein MACH17_34070 [Phaeobacter inhibens]
MCIAGTIGIFVVEAGQLPSNIVFFRCLIGALSLVVISVLTGGLSFREVTRKDWILIAVGGACLVYNWLFLFMSYQTISLSLGTVVYHIKPFVIMLVGAFIFSERLTGHAVAWTGLAFAGMMLVVEISFDSLQVEAGKALGIVYALIAALMYSASTLIVKYVRSASGIKIALLQTSLGVFLLLPFTQLSELSLGGGSWIFVLTLGVLNTGVMYSLNYSAYQRLPSYSIAVLSFIYPIVTIVTDYIFYGFLFNWVQMAGVVMIFAATLGVNLGWRILPKLRTQKSF